MLYLWILSTRITKTSCFKNIILQNYSGQSVPVIVILLQTSSVVSLVICYDFPFYSGFWWWYIGGWALISVTIFFVSTFIVVMMMVVVMEMLFCLHNSSRLLESLGLLWWRFIWWVYFAWHKYIHSLLSCFLCVPFWAFFHFFSFFFKFFSSIHLNIKKN